MFAHPEEKYGGLHPVGSFEHEICYENLQNSISTLTELCSFLDLEQFLNFLFKNMLPSCRTLDSGAWILNVFWRIIM